MVNKNHLKIPDPYPEISSLTFPYLPIIPPLILLTLLSFCHFKTNCASNGSISMSTKGSILVSVEGKSSKRVPVERNLKMNTTKNGHIIHGPLLKPFSTQNIFWRWMLNMERRWMSRRRCCPLVGQRYYACMVYADVRHIKHIFDFMLIDADV